MRDGTGRPMSLSDAALEAALRDLGTSLATPRPGDRPAGLDPAGRARLRIAAGPERRRGAVRWFLPGWPARRSLGGSVGLALIVLVVLAAVVGAIGFGLPGIRIVPAPSASTGGSIPGSGQASASPSIPGASSPAGSGGFGSQLGLGIPIAVSDTGRAIDVPIALPVGPGLGPPASAWLLEGRLSLVWPVSDALPATAEPRIGLLISEFRGSIQPGYFEKAIGPGTTVEPVQVGGLTGYWISGAAHEIVYVGANGDPVFDSRRSVGDTLIWTLGDVTYRLESGLGRADAIALAETLR